MYVRSYIKWKYGVHNEYVLVHFHLAQSRAHSLSPLLKMVPERIAQQATRLCFSVLSSPPFQATKNVFAKKGTVIIYKLNLNVNPTWAYAVIPSGTQKRCGKGLTVLQVDFPRGSNRAVDTARIIPSNSVRRQISFESLQMGRKEMSKEEGIPSKIRCCFEYGYYRSQ